MPTIFAAIDAIAVMALVALAIVSFARQESVWMGIFTAVVALWAAVRFFGIV
ncbi:hypothetical protein [Aminobacter sp. HY435]|uniref:hypothetical protein n=1 Tax=Aminobacter sp. HY435 TaxID=2970917 RepID=UPI0022B9B755|nr:hypothetical protein [Aminobacter sp. HY435]